MNRIELYLDRNERLTIDFFLTQKDENDAYRTKGKQCYPLIQSLCKSPLLSITESSNGEDIYLVYKNFSLNISEYKKVFEKVGTGPIKLSIKEFKEKQKLSEIKPKKVTRKNKYVGKKIIASVLILSVIGAIIAKEVSDKIKKSSDDFTEDESYVQEIDQATTNNAFVIDNLSYEVPNYITHPIEVGYIETEQKIEEPENDLEIFISFEDRSSTERARITKAYYGGTIEKYSNMFGVDPQILIAIATQERGIHSDKRDPGGATGLMQIENSVWLNQNLTAYNYEKNQYETILVTEDNISDVYYNIKFGCMIFQNCMDYMDNNVLAAIQCYNMGYGNMMKILKQYSAYTGKSVSEILADVTDTGWLEYRDMINVGDRKYLERVLSWIGPNITFGNVNLNEAMVNLNISNENAIKNMSYN